MRVCLLISGMWSSSILLLLGSCLAQHKAINEGCEVLTREGREMESSTRSTTFTCRTISVSPFAFSLCFFILLFQSLQVAAGSSQCQAWLVQSIPTDMPHLAPVPGVLSTADVLRWLAGNSTQSLDIIAQYWQLVSRPDDPRSGDYGYSKADLEKFGANDGFEVFKSIETAADRDVDVRILQHKGVYPDYTDESSNLASGRPNVKNVTLMLDEWWGSGIVHAKVWISDHKDVYIGSANNDWKALTQVKEVGIYLVGCSNVARKVEIYFDNLWKLASLNSSDHTKTVWDNQWQIERKVPCWSHFVNSNERCRSPLPSYVKVPHVEGYPTLSDPYMFQSPIETPGCNNATPQQQSSYLSFAPPELSFGKFQSDEQAWVDTIKSVKPNGTLRISTMNWLGQSQFTRKTVYWPSLTSAISEVVFSKNATVKLLVAYWAHNINITPHHLDALLYTNILCASDKKCFGKVEIKYYKVPGYNMTGPALQQLKNGTTVSTGNIYPGYTRVNHGKYAVSDVRSHIGTSNLIWDYFYTTSGVSFGTYNPAIVSQLQQIFDADWESPYAVSAQETSAHPTL